MCSISIFLTIVEIRIGIPWAAFDLIPHKVAISGKKFLNKVEAVSKRRRTKCLEHILIYENAPEGKTSVVKY